MAELKKLSVDSDYRRSPMFNQTAFTGNEISWHFRTTFITFCILFYVIGFKLEVLVLLIRYAPFPLVQLVGHGPKCIFMTLTMMWASLISAIMVKQLFYVVVAWMYELEPLQPQDEIHLYDLPVNPINIPGYMVLKKEKDKVYDWDKLYDTLKNRYHWDPECRNFMKVEKKFGKYFLKKQTHEEWEASVKRQTGIVDDITSEEEAIEFALKLKTITTH